MNRFACKYRVLVSYRQNIREYSVFFLSEFNVCFQIEIHLDVLVINGNQNNLLLFQFESVCILWKENRIFCFYIYKMI